MTYNGENIYIRFIGKDDTEDLLALTQRNRTHFEQVSPKRDESYYSQDFHEKMIEGWIKQREEDKRYVFGIFLKESDQLIGDISIFDIKRGPVQNCTLGYGLDQEHNGKGYMTEAIQLLLTFAFEEAKLQRVEAGVMPRNIGSIRVLEKAGFQREGLARKLLEINGTREDHVIFAMLAEDMKI
ncbi:alanine acetyltransferase [Paenibacillus pectinilyticus]|uniref:Alanine acetyltransferase n=1 Tax=Paenibacillus pectinilyticus TaxID=512399 RepID=A0A1C0ZVZ9_9BACL|nr:GNAT family protein [Paenibacillus pectinilyticus]OCT12286.1 alanine acetyltransferase [Paenibacillus pectinilyticus]